MIISIVGNFVYTDGWSVYAIAIDMWMPLASEGVKKEYILLEVD